VRNLFAEARHHPHLAEHKWQTRLAWYSCRPAGGEQASPGAAYPPAGSSNAFKAQLRNHVTPIAEELAQRGGIPAAERDLYDKTSLTHSLEQDYLPVNMEQPGLSIQSLEPPVFTIDNFMTSEECQQLAQAAEATGVICCHL
jgi:hypothetical protein